VDLSCLPARGRPHPGEVEPPENGTLLLLHAEMTPPRGIEQPPPGLIAAYEGSTMPEAPWRKVEVPNVGAYPRLSSCIQTAWREWAGQPLPRPLAIRLSSHPWKEGEAELLRLLQTTVRGGIPSLKEFLLLSGSALAGKTPWKSQKRRLERSLVERALQEEGGNRTRAAKVLGVHRNTLLWHLRRLNRPVGRSTAPKIRENH
jgi:hypothetical protein